MLGLRRSLRASWSLCSSCCLGRSFAALAAVAVVVAARSSHVVSVSRRRPALARGLLATGEETAVRRRVVLVAVAVVVAWPSHVVSISRRLPALGHALPDCGSGRLGRVGRRWLGHRGEEGSGGGVKAEAATTGRSCDGEKWAGLG